MCSCCGGSDSPAGACRSLPSAISSGPASAQEKLTFIADHFQEAIEEDAFCRYVDERSLETLVRNDRLHAEELQVFQGVVRWGRYQCQRQGLPVNPKNIRAQINTIIPHIRFPTMSFEDLSGPVKESEVLSAEELVECFVYKGAKAGSTNGEPLERPRYPTRPRVGLYLRMQRLRAEYATRELRSMNYQRCYHCCQLPLSMAIPPSLFLIFIVLICRYSDAGHGGVLKWWHAYIPLWAMVAFIVFNFAWMWYFYYRDRHVWTPSNRGLVCFHGFYNTDDGMYKEIWRNLEGGGGRAWLFVFISELVIALILLAVWYAWGIEAFPVWVVWIMPFVVMVTICCGPWAFGADFNRGSNAGVLVFACCCVWVPFVVLLALMLVRQLDPQTMPMWAALIPVQAWLACGILACCAACLSAVFQSYNREEPAIISLVLCVVLSPLIIGVVFICLRSAAEDTKSSVPWWVPSIMEAAAPFIAILAVLAVAGVVGACATRRNLPTPHSNGPPEYLLEHMEPPQP